MTDQKNIKDNLIGIYDMADREKNYFTFQFLGCVCQSQTALSTRRRTNKDHQGPTRTKDRPTTGHKFDGKKQKLPERTYIKGKYYSGSKKKSVLLCKCSAVPWICCSFFFFTLNTKECSCLWLSLASKTKASSCPFLFFTPHTKACSCAWWQNSSCMVTGSSACSAVLHFLSDLNFLVSCVLWPQHLLTSDWLHKCFSATTNPTANAPLEHHSGCQCDMFLKFFPNE